MGDPPKRRSAPFGHPIVEKGPPPRPDERMMATPVLRDPDEDLTGNYEGEELAQMRAKRPTDERIARLETKQDRFEQNQRSLERNVAEWRVANAKGMGELAGAIGKLTGEVAGIARRLDDQAAKGHIVFRQQIDLDRAEAESDIKVREAKQLDTIEAGKTKRNLIAKIVGAILGSAVFLDWILHRFGVF